VRVGYDADLERALDAARVVLAENPRILKTPPPDVGITRLEDSGVEITLRPWCKAEEFWSVHYEVYRALLDRFHQQGIEIPRPQREVRLLPTAA